MKPNNLIYLLGFLIILTACNEQTVRKQGYEVHGIDVSHYQKEINWEKVASQDIQFAFIKATEGETYKDTFFCENWSGMKAANIKRGAYHFFRPTLSAELQAANFIETAELGHGDFAPVLDIEVTDGVSQQELLEKIDTWLTLVENHFKVKPIIYTYQKFFNKHLADRYDDHPIWIARYSSWRNPNLSSDQEWQFWQYGNKGKLRGINGPVDFNIFKGTKDELEQFCLIRPAPMFDPPPAPTSELVATNP